MNTVKKIYYDVVSKKILAQTIRTRTGSANEYLGLDFWRNNIPECFNNPSFGWEKDYIYVAKEPLNGANYE